MSNSFPDFAFAYGPESLAASRCGSQGWQRLQATMGKKEKGGNEPQNPRFEPGFVRPAGKSTGIGGLNIHPVVYESSSNIAYHIFLPLF